MDIVEATQQYEQWLGARVRVLPDDLEHKHSQMALAPFPFLRATFYHWASLWRERFPDAERATTVLSVGDLHIENYGTWRDAEGRLVWGVNDFDEAFPLPWTFDLVRLSTSAQLAVEANHLGLRERAACRALLDGYSQAIDRGGQPFVLAEDHDWLRKMALGKLRSPVKFWNKLASIPSWDLPVDAAALAAMRALLPDPELPCRVIHRIAGLGSLGRERFTLIADWKGGRIAREAKALTTSACGWAFQCDTADVHYSEILQGAVRIVDPFVGVSGGWVVRRLAPDCTRVELSSLENADDEVQLLFSMGFELGNIHLGTPGAQSTLRAQLGDVDAEWLYRASKLMTAETHRAWKQWRNHWAARA